MKKHTSRAVSHSKSSNAVLTSLCLIGAFGFSGVAAFLGLANILPQQTYVLGAVVSGAVLLVSAVALMAFKR